MDLTFAIEGEVQLSRRLMIMADGGGFYGAANRYGWRTANRVFRITLRPGVGCFKVVAGRRGQHEELYSWPILEKTGALRHSLIRSRISLLSIFSTKHHTSSTTRAGSPRTYPTATPDYDED